MHLRDYKLNVKAKGFSNQEIKQMVQKKTDGNLDK